MDDNEMARRLRLIREIVTPVHEVVNRIIDVGADGVTVRSVRTDNDRTIPFEDIRNRSTSHGCIIDSFRQILGLEGAAVEADSLAASAAE